MPDGVDHEKHTHGCGPEVAIRAKDKPLRALLYAGRPQAYADYPAGRFGPS